MANKKASFLTQEVKENHLISLAKDAAEKQLIEGTASSQIITHYLRLATVKYQLELESLKADNALKAAKTNAINDSREDKELYLKAIEAFTKYSGEDEEL